MDFCAFDGSRSGGKDRGKKTDDYTLRHDERSRNQSEHIDPALKAAGWVCRGPGSAPAAPRAHRSTLHRSTAPAPPLHAPAPNARRRSGSLL